MKRPLISAIIALCAASGAFAQTQNDYNRAIMQAYADQMRENYKDYETLFRRANTYYANGDYLKAMDDLDSALKSVRQRIRIHALQSTPCARNVTYNSSAIHVLCLKPTKR